MIAARDLSLTLDGRVILHPLSFEVARGEAVALVGANGSGKTSILRCVLGLVPFAGQVTIEGHDVRYEPIVTRALVGYVPQRAAFGDVTARDVLAFVAKLRRIAPERIATMLGHMGLAAHAGARVRTFSGGMLQRLALAVALLPDPPIVLFDEPTANLDREGQGLFYDVVARLRAEGHTLVLASHRAEEVESLTDRLLHVDRGRIAAAPAHPAGRVVPFPARGELR